MIHPYKRGKPEMTLRAKTYQLVEPLEYAEIDQPCVAMAPTGEVVKFKVVRGAFYSQDRFERGQAVMIFHDGFGLSQSNNQADGIMDAAFFERLIHDTPSETERWIQKVFSADADMQELVLRQVLNREARPNSRRAKKPIRFSSWGDMRDYFQLMEPFMDSYASVIDSWLRNIRVNPKDDTKSERKAFYYFNSLPQLPMQKYDHERILQTMKKKFPEPELESLVHQIASAFSNADRSRVCALIVPGESLSNRTLHAISNALELDLMQWSCASITSSATFNGADSVYESSNPGTIITRAAVSVLDMSCEMMVFKLVDALAGAGSDRGKDGGVVEELEEILRTRSVKSAFLDGVPVPLTHSHMIVTAQSREGIPESIRVLCEDRIFEFPEIDNSLAADLLKSGCLETVTRRNHLPHGWIDDETLAVIASYRTDLGIDSAEELLSQIAHSMTENDRIWIDAEEAGRWLSDNQPDADREPITRYHLNEGAYPDWQKREILAAFIKLSFQQEDMTEIERRAVKKRLTLLTKLIPRDVQPFSAEVFDRETAKVVGVELEKERLKSLFMTQTPVLLIGPPGNGKTTLARATAKASGRSMVEIHVAGRDAESLQGISPWTNSADASVITRGMANKETTSCVLFLDEVDKLSITGQNALIEILDDSKEPMTIDDHFLEVEIPFNAQIIMTANDISRINPALLSRVEIIELDGYTPFEKEQILKCFAEQENVQLSEKAQKALVTQSVLREAGVREMKHALLEFKGCLLRGANEDDVLREMRLPYIYHADHQVPGQVNGLAVTGAECGCLMPIYAIKLPDKADACVVTGLAKEELRDSIAVALTWLRERYGIEDHYHLHFLPAGVAKAGPSAGAAIAIAMYSAAMDMPTEAGVCITGEFDGNAILPVGGLTQKLSAAAVSGLKIAIVPEACRGEVPPSEHFPGLEVVFVSSIDEVIQRVFPRPKQIELAK